jgi:hypothetical protein
MSLVLFHRNYKRFQGGHLKVFHYFEHVRSSSSHDARIRFTADSVFDEANPWSALRKSVVAPDEPLAADVLFLAGTDWRQLDPVQRADSPVPILNLIQGLSDSRRFAAMHEFIGNRAIRICVSPEIQEGLEATGKARGPVLTVPIGLDLEALPAPRPAAERDIDCMVLGVKDPRSARSIARKLERDGGRVLLVERPLPRGELLEAMARSRVTVHLPIVYEGAYLPALESMALGALVVCPDCVGNRSFCRDGDTCFVPGRRKRAIAAAAIDAMRASPQELEPLLRAARQESAARSLAAERTRFLEVLENVQELWAP